MHTLHLVVKGSRVPMSVNTGDQEFYLSPHHLLAFHSVTQNSLEINVYTSGLQHAFMEEIIHHMCH